MDCRRYRSLYRPMKKLADKYADICGYRQHGLKYDDLIIEENETVQKALKRLTPREEYDRAYRLRVASQLSVLHHPLPKEQQLTQQQVSLTALAVSERASEREPRESGSKASNASPLAATLSSRQSLFPDLIANSLVLVISRRTRATSPHSSRRL